MMSARSDIEGVHSNYLRSKILPCGHRLYLDGIKYYLDRTRYYLKECNAHVNSSMYVKGISYLYFIISCQICGVICREFCKHVLIFTTLWANSASD